MFLHKVKMQASSFNMLAQAHVQFLHAQTSTPTEKLLLLQHTHTCNLKPLGIIYCDFTKNSVKRMALGCFNELQADQSFKANIVFSRLLLLSAAFWQSLVDKTNTAERIVTCAHMATRYNGSACSTYYTQRSPSFYTTTFCKDCKIYAKVLKATINP